MEDFPNVLIFLTSLTNRTSSISKDDEMMSQKKSDGIVNVVWDCGTMADYRAGFNGAYDLRVISNPQNFL